LDDDEVDRGKGDGEGTRWEDDGEGDGKGGSGESGEWWGEVRRSGEKFQSKF
jgi:hypothetical protein